MIKYCPVTFTHTFVSSTMGTDEMEDLKDG